MYARPCTQQKGPKPVGGGLLLCLKFPAQAHLPHIMFAGVAFLLDHDDETKYDSQIYTFIVAKGKTISFVTTKLLHPEPKPVGGGHEIVAQSLSGSYTAIMR